MDIRGFRVNFLGDSITEGVGVRDRANNRYDNRLAAMCGLAGVNNYGISGTRLAHQVHASEKPRYDLCFCGRAYDMDTCSPKASSFTTDVSFCIQPLSPTESLKRCWASRASTNISATAAP